MAVMMVIGNPYLPWITINPLDMVRTLPSTIALEFSYVEFFSMHYYSLFGMGVVLFASVFVMNLLATYFTGRSEK
jgi:phosphate transport system permease protein